MKGIILAGGSGTRLYPLTLVTSKQLLPVFNKPMIYYPMSVLMLAGIKDILIISTPTDISRISDLLGDGSKYGINISYKVQPSPDGLAQAFVLAEDFIKDDSVAMILGDNIYHGAGLIEKLKKAIDRADLGTASIFGYRVKDPERFGVVELDKEGNALSIEEKPACPKSNYCVTGLYFYPKGVSKIAKIIKKSDRGEYEITSLNNYYIQQHKLYVSILGRGYTWLDAGTPESLAEATNYVQIIESHQRTMIACLEEISYINGWISKEKLLEEAKLMTNSDYGKHLLNVVNGKIKY